MKCAQKRTLYEKFDDTLMYCANKAVDTWNWTTGRTKSDLVRTVLGLAPIVQAASPFFSSEDVPNDSKMLNSSILGAIGLLTSYHLNNLNETINDGERRSNGERLDFVSESLKDVPCKVMGPSFLALSGVAETNSILLNSSSANVVATALALDAFSLYLMRASNPPARKNCVSRGIEYVKELIAETKLKPVYAEVRN